MNLIGNGMTDIPTMRGELTKAVNDASTYYSRCEAAYNSRNCVWNGQSEDGRKHGEELGREAFPWEGASDTKIRTVDEVVQEQTKVMLAGFFRSRIQAVGTEVMDAEKAARITALLKWMLYGRMKPQIRREVELAANWRQLYGAAITCVQWDQELRAVDQPVGIEDLTVLSLLFNGEQPEQYDLPALQATYQEWAFDPDPDRERGFQSVIQGLSELVTREKSAQLHREFRQTGSMVIPFPEVFNQMPRWTALMPMVDIFFPASTDDIQRARWIAHREMISEPELWNRVQTAGYDPEWVEEACGRKGRSLLANQWVADFTMNRGQDFYGIHSRNQDMIEIFHWYYKARGENNLPSVYTAVMSQNVDGFAIHEKHLYEHGKYPYAQHVAESAQRCILESRGVAEIAGSWQQEIKVQRDARVDVTSLRTMPPMIVPPARVAKRMLFGPGVQLPKRRGEDIEWMQMPGYDPGSIEIEKATQRNVDRHFALMSGDNPPERVMLYQQDLVDGFLGEVKEVGTQSFQLMQQYLPKATVVRVVGGSIESWTVTREEIQGGYDIQIDFDARDLNPDLVKQKLGLFQEMLGMDRQGILNGPKMLEIAARGIDPWMADALLQDPQQASQNEAEDELNVWAKMVAGVETPLPDIKGGINAQLRIQVLQQTIQQNPEIQQMLQARPLLMGMVEQRFKALGFQIQQQENAQIGRTGGQSVLQGSAMPPVG